MGVWIETISGHGTVRTLKVTPCMGVWIETRKLWTKSTNSSSHPVWVCGLKLFVRSAIVLLHSHTLYGCVD